MITVIKKEIKISPGLLSKIEWACAFSKTTPKIVNGTLRIIKHTNLAYVRIYFKIYQICCTNERQKSRIKN